MIAGFWTLLMWFPHVSVSKESLHKRFKGLGETSSASLGPSRWPGWAEGLWFASFFWWVLRQRWWWWWWGGFQCYCYCWECWYCWYCWLLKGLTLAFLELGVPKFQESVIWGEAADWFWLSILLSTAVRVRLPSDVPRWLLTCRFFTSRHTAVCQNMLGFLSFADCKHHLQLWTSGWFLENDSTWWKSLCKAQRVDASHYVSSDAESFSLAPVLKFQLPHCLHKIYR